jgi:hypothetical protein
MTITDEQARIIGREIGQALAEKLAAELKRGTYHNTLGDRIVEVIKTAVREDGGRL